MNVSEKSAIGINVDNLGFESMDQIKYVIDYRHKDVTGSLTQPIPAGYMLHVIIANHSATSSGNPATLIAGTSPGGTEYIEQENGYIDQVGQRYSFSQHDLAEHLYLNVTGVAVKLDIFIQFIYAL